MAFIRIFQPANVTAEMYDAVNEKAGVLTDPPAGLVFHCAGDANGTWQILDVWDTKEQAEKFDEERLVPAIESVIGMRPPESAMRDSYELHRVIKP